MEQGLVEAVAVLDVGKTHSKLSLVSREGVVGVPLSRANMLHAKGNLRFLDTDAIEQWVVTSLGALAREAEIAAIVPVAHGATAALVSADALAAPVLDYETEPPDDVRESYRRLRDPFARTLSPPLPDGLNLGLQLFWQEQLYPAEWPSRAQALPWPQYWAWRLSGAAASEVTSLGCHTDLWFPYENAFSDLARTRGWADRFPSRAHAGAVLGTLRPELAAATALSRRCGVFCGLHDSNAALLAARSVPDVRGHPFVLVSTGTWFVTLQSGSSRRNALDPSRDTLVNVDVDAKPTPSARFMGGREYEAIVGDDIGARATVVDAERLVARGTTTRPSFVTGCGPFPDSRGAILGETHTPGERAALASLHLAFLEAASLDLISAEGPVLLEGRFAADPIFAGALACLRSQPVYRCAHGDGVALGAARLALPELSSVPAERVPPLPLDLSGYAARFRG